MTYPTLLELMGIVCSFNEVICRNYVSLPRLFDVELIEKILPNSFR